MRSLKHTLAHCTLALLFGCSSSSGGADGAAGGGASASGGAPANGGASGSAGVTASAGANNAGANNGAAGATGISGSAGASGAGASGAGASSAGASGAGASSAGASSAGASSAGAAGSLAGWTLTWSDEFNGADGSAADPSKWVHDVGGDGWGNQELEYYTDGTQNALVQGGNLLITATTEGAAAHTCSYPANGPCTYTSARLKTQGKFSQQYGRFEARVQMPEGDGIWPAFWALGADIASVSWPSCGEIDIMENIGKEPSINHGSLHLPAAGSTNDSQLTGQYTLPGNAKLGDAFHTYAVEWSAAAIKFYVDDQLYETQSPTTASGRTWEFDKPFFIILNVAVGGQFPGPPTSSSSFPQTMKVDWVRVYSPASN